MIVADVVVTVLTVFGVIVVTAVIFCLWLVATLIGTVLRLLRWGARMVFPQPVQQVNWRVVGARVETVRCERPRCGAENPVEARYCRRCGKKMARGASCGAQHVAVRRVAMW